MTTAEAVIFTRAREQSHARIELQGTLPSFVRGTIYMNGPAGFDYGQRRHWLDGDGLVRALTLDGDKIGFRSKYVRTHRFLREKAAKAPIYRSFGTAFENDVLIDGRTLATPANVSAYPFAGKILAFGEQSLPYLLDPATLETEGPIDFGEEMAGIGVLSAHPKFANERMADFGIRYFGKRARLYYYEFDRALRVVVRNHTVLPAANVIHDFALSEHHAVFHVGPYTLDARALMKEGASLLDALAWDTAGESCLIILDRTDGREVARVSLPETSFCLHLVNAHEADGRVVVDLLETDGPYYAEYTAAPHMFSRLGESRARRFAVEKGEIEATRTGELGGHADFPSIASGTTGTEQDRFWMLGMDAPAPSPKFYDRLLCFDWSLNKVIATWRADHWLGGEPVVIPDPDSDRLVVACQHLSPERDCGWLFFDGTDLTRGPIARLDLPEFDSPGFHTAWQA